jgi:hypothetical protein
MHRIKPGRFESRTGPEMARRDDLNLLNLAMHRSWLPRHVGSPMPLFGVRPQMRVTS